MAGRFVAAASGLLLAAGVGAFVAERAGWFDPADWRDALPGEDASETAPPAERTEAPAPEPADQQSQTRVAPPERKPAPDAVAPARKPDTAVRTAERDPEETPAQANRPEDAADPTVPGPDGATRAGNANSGRDAEASTRAVEDTPSAPDADAQDRRASRGEPVSDRASAGVAESGEPAPEEDAGDAASRTRQGTSGVGDPDRGMQVTVPARDGGDEEARGAEIATGPQPRLPSFDIVRVERSGEAVIAGRAAPRSRVTVMQDDRPIATVEADDRGEFVAIPPRRLPPGQRQLTLRAEDPESGQTTESDRAVVIDIPRPADATRPEAAENSQTAESSDDQARRGAQLSARDGSQTGDETPPTGVRGDGGPSADVASAPESAGGEPEPSPKPSAGEQEKSGSRVATRGTTSSGKGDAPIAVLVPREGTGEVEVLQRPSGESGLEDRELVLEAVQYTVDGGISISGQAPAEALVVAYLNDTEMARTRAPADGAWTMAPDADVPPGLHTLRVDLVGPDGQVQARVSTPFANQPMVDELDAGEGMVVIQPGDNLWTIARRSYGQGWEYTLIYRANSDQIRDPDLIYPGQVFVVPEGQRQQGEAGD